MFQLALRILFPWLLLSRAPREQSTLWMMILLSSSIYPMTWSPGMGLQHSARTYLDLIVSLEEEFAMTIPLEEVGNMVNFKYIKLIIEEQA